MDILSGLVVAASLLGMLKQILIGILAIVNGILAIIATLAIWKSYLVMGVKVLMTLVVAVPVIGVIVYLIWGQKKVRDAK